MTLKMNYGWSVRYRCRRCIARVALPLSSVLNAKANLSGEMALRIDKAFGVKMDTLMRMQSITTPKTRSREK